MKKVSKEKNIDIIDTGAYRVRFQKLGVRFEALFTTESLAVGYRNEIQAACAKLKLYGLKKIEPLGSLSFDEIMANVDGLPAAIIDMLNPESDESNPTLHEAAIKVMNFRIAAAKAKGKKLDLSLMLYWMKEDYFHEASGKLHRRPVNQKTGELRPVPAVANMRIKDIKPSHLMELRQEMLLETSPSTTNRHFFMAQGIVSSIITGNMLNIANPFKSLTSKKAGDYQKPNEEEGRVHTLNWKDAQILHIGDGLYAEDAKNQRENTFGVDDIFLYWGPLWEAVVETGIRVQFVMNLNIKEIIKTDSGWLVQKTMSMKGSTPKVPLSSEAVAVLQEQWHIAEANNGYFFPVRPNTAVSRVNYPMMHKLMEECCDDRTMYHPWHSLRGAMATNMHFADVPENMGADILGVSVEVYRNYITKHNEEAYFAALAKMGKTRTRRRPNRAGLKVVK